MTIFIKLLFTTTIYFSLLNYVYASQLDDLRGYINQKKYEEAYLLADKIKLDNEGDPVFDYMYAQAALETGRPDIAVFALERVIANQEENQLARLELARAYYLKGEFDKSKTLFNLILAASPPPNVKNNINLFLNKIDSFLKTSSYQTSAFVELAYGWDDNINAASDENSVTIGNLVFLLNSNNKIDATYAKIIAGGNYLKRINKYDSFFFGAQLESRDNLSEDLDTDEISLRTGYLSINNNKRYSIPLSYQKLNLDGEGYRQVYSISSEWSFFDNETEYTSYVIQLGAIEYDEQTALDLKFANIAYSNTFLINNKKNVMSISAFLGSESPDIEGNELNMRDYVGLSLDFYNVDYSGLFSGLKTYQFKHQDLNPTFNDTRKDILSSINIGYKWKPKKHWLIIGQLGYSDNSSNIDLYSYDRTTAEITLRVDF